MEPDMPAIVISSFALLFLFDGVLLMAASEKWRKKLSFLEKLSDRKVQFIGLFMSLASIVILYATDFAVIRLLLGK